MTADSQAQPCRQWFSSVFGGDPGFGRPLARGNATTVTRVSPLQLQHSTSLQRLSASASTDTSCYFSAAESPARFPVRCFNRSDAISCCGHGLYAIAGILAMDMPGLAPRQLSMAGCSVPVTVNGAQIAIGLPVLPLQAAGVPAWAVDAVGLAPESVVVAGDEGGYALWIYPSPDQVLALTPVAAVLRASTRRAVIASSWDPRVPSGFVLRYFAPQYGAPEDPVTGSAMRVAATYWQRQSGNDCFAVWQCSAAGGLAALQLEGHYCWLQGRHAARRLPDRQIMAFPVTECGDEQ